VDDLPRYWSIVGAKRTKTDSENEAAQVAVHKSQGRQGSSILNNKIENLSKDLVRQ
jgi:hypothetical protein